MPYLLLLLGVFACSTAVIFVKLSAIDPVLLSGFRLAIAAVVTLPLFLRDWRRHAETMTRGHLLDAAIPGVVLAGHFVSWIIGARLTPAANCSLIVNLVPVAMPLLLYFIAHERLNRQERIATAIAMVGVVFLFASDYQITLEYFKGDLICFGSMVLFAAYLALGRRYRHHPTVWLYLTPLYASAALSSFALAPLMASWEPIDWQTEWVWVLALGLIPTIVGHSLLNNAMRSLRGQVVSVVNMAQFVFAGIMAYIWLQETPHWTLCVASIAVVAAGVIATREAKHPAAKPSLDESQENAS